MYDYSQYFNFKYIEKAKLSICCILKSSKYEIHVDKK